MTKIAIIIDGDYVYPVYRIEDKYHIDLGNSVGMSGPFEFKSDVKAITWLRKHVKVSA